MLGTMIILLNNGVRIIIDIKLNNIYEVYEFRNPKVLFVTIFGITEYPLPNKIGCKCGQIFLLKKSGIRFMEKNIGGILFMISIYKQN